MRFVNAFILAYALSVAGCAFSDWATRRDPAYPDRATPAARAGGEILRDTLTGFEAGGVYAGFAALIFTVGKTGARLYNDYQAYKAKAKSEQQK